MPLMRSSGSWCSVEETGSWCSVEETVSTVTSSFSSCLRCLRISCDKEKSLSSVGSGIGWGRWGGSEVRTSHVPTQTYP